MLHLNYKTLGRTIQGTVMDCNRKYLERALKDYEPRLYTKWNPDKNGGLGMWEIRIRPTQKTAVPRWMIGDAIGFELQYVELDTVNHVKDVPCLNYDILNWLKAHDSYDEKNWVKEWEYKEDKSYEAGIAKTKADLKYAIKHNKRGMADLREYARSGKDLAALFTGKW